MLGDGLMVFFVSCLNNPLLCFLWSMFSMVSTEMSKYLFLPFSWAGQLMKNIENPCHTN